MKTEQEPLILGLCFLNLNLENEKKLISRIHKMDHMQMQGDLTNVKDVQESALSSKVKRSSSDNLADHKDSLERAQKRKAVNKEIECNDVHDEGGGISKKLVRQPDTLEDEVQSRNESNNPSMESIRTRDYWDSPLNVNDGRAERLVAVPKFTYDPVKVRRELTKMIIMHEYPLSVVDNIGLRDFLRNLNPSFEMVSQKTIENDIMKIFRFEKCIAHGELNGCDAGRVAVTTKMWTSSDGNRRFLAITGHVIDQEWKKNSYIMRFVNVPLPCRNESISKIILRCLLDFTVEKNPSTITVDSYTSDDELIDILQDKLSGNNFFVRGKLFRLPCFACTVSLMVQDGFDVIRHVLKKSVLVSCFGLLHHKEKRPLRKPHPSWSSTYLMLQESLDFKDVFSHLGQQESCPSEEKWDLARELSEWLNCELPLIKEMASKMVEKFDKYWLVARDILGVESVFYPKYKFWSLEHFFPKIYGSEAEGEIERIRQIFKDLFIQYKHSLPVDEPNDEELRSRVSDLMYMIIMEEREEKKKQPELHEVDLYVKYGRSTRDSEVLSWWENHTNYTVLSKMAKDILAIPIFSVDAENAFDVGDRILGANHNRLHPTMVETLMCTRSWVRYQKRLKLAASSAASNIYTLGTIYDDAISERGITLKAKSAKEGAELGD
ncbi:Zinc finger BED domain-containing protein RICESLEEPER 1 [Bienertia sinuspersici]